MSFPFVAAERVVALGAGIALALAGAAMFAQVVARFVFAAPFVWAEEFAVLMFAWITFLGAGAVQADDSHLSIDTLRGALPPRGKVVLDALRRGVIAACSGVLIWQGIALSQRMAPIEFPAMEITRAWLYASVPVGFAFVLLFALRQLVAPHAPPGSTDVPDAAA
jgi:TRAP-type C4-dicarboxylate transport system permease small subunit